MRRRIGLVYSVALRHARGDRHRAEDATQAVFTDLARKAASLAGRPVLAGWLYRSAQFAATALVRAEARRHVREQEAHRMENDSAREDAAVDWDRVRPVLDEALNAIDERDRDAIVLRFFDGRPFAEIGRQLALTENAARMRVERALDKLQAALTRRGITSTAGALGLALAQQVGAAAPAGLAATVTGVALAGGAAGGATAAAALFTMTKLQIAAAGALALAGTALFVTQARSNAALRAEVAALHVPPAALAASREENRQLARTATEVELLRADDAEFRQLEQRVAEARQAQAERARAARIAADALTAEQARAEIERLNKEGNLLVAQYKQHMERAKNPALTAADRAQAAEMAQAKLEEIKAKQRQVTDYKAHASALLGPEFARASVPVLSARQESVPASSVTFVPGAPIDAARALEIYEQVASVKIVRDPALAGHAAVGDFNVKADSRSEVLEQMRVRLKQQFNIVLERAPDGTLVARRAGP